MAISLLQFCSYIRTGYVKISFQLQDDHGTRQRHGQHGNQRPHQGIVTPTGSSAAEMVNVFVDPICAMGIVIVMMEVTKTGITVLQQVSF